MTRSFALLAGGLALAKAQMNLPQCGQTCVNNMLEIAVSQFGCDQNDLASCACCNVDFGYGIRDCSREVCGDGSQDYSSVIAYGSSYCASAVTSCPSGTQASTVLATATGGSGSSNTASGAMSMSSPAMTSGPLAGAIGAIGTVSGSSNAYVVNGQTITPGGNTYGDGGTTYSALPSGAGVLVDNGDTQTTVMPGMIGAGGMNGSMSGSGSGMMTMTSGGSGSGGALGAAAGSVSAVSGSSNQYVIGDSTISAGGDGTDDNDTSYTALPSGQGVQVVANGQTTTVNPASASASTTGGMGGGAGGAGASSSSSGSGNGGSGNGGAAGGGSNNGGSNNNGNNNSGSSSSSDTGNIAPMQTAAPALIGAAAMAILAL